MQYKIKYVSKLHILMTYNVLKLQLHAFWVQVYCRDYSMRNFFSLPVSIRAGVAQSLQRLATGLTVRKSNPIGGEIFRTCPDRLWDTTSLLHNECCVFPGGKAAEGCS